MFYFNATYNCSKHFWCSVNELVYHKWLLICLPVYRHDSKMSIVHIYFQRNSFVPQLRQELYTIPDLIGNYFTQIWNQKHVPNFPCSFTSFNFMLIIINYCTFFIDFYSQHRKHFDILLWVQYVECGGSHLFLYLSGLLEKSSTWSECGSNPKFN